MEHGQKSKLIENKQRLQDSLGFLINGLARLMRTALEVRLHDTGLSPTTWTVIMALGEEDGLSQTDLSRRTFLDGATITRALDQLTELSCSGYDVSLSNLSGLVFEHFDDMLCQILLYFPMSWYRL